MRRSSNNKNNNHSKTISRFSQTLSHIKNLHWVVIEDANVTVSIIENTNIRFSTFWICCVLLALCRLRWSVDGLFQNLTKKILIRKKSFWIDSCTRANEQEISVPSGGTNSATIRPALRLLPCNHRTGHAEYVVIFRLTVTCSNVDDEPMHFKSKGSMNDHDFFTVITLEKDESRAIALSTALLKIGNHWLTHKFSLENKHELIQCGAHFQSAVGRIAIALFSSSGRTTRWELPPSLKDQRSKTRGQWSCFICLFALMDQCNAFLSLVWLKDSWIQRKLLNCMTTR